MKKAVTVFAASALFMLTGCNYPTLLPNSDPNLRKKSTWFAADAAKRHPYKADAPRGGEALAKSEYNLTFGTLQILNYGNEPWDDLEVWVNHNYVVFIKRLEPAAAGAKLIDFNMLFDDSGNTFSTDGGKIPVTSVEIYRKGKMYTVPAKLAD